MLFVDVVRCPSGLKSLVQNSTTCKNHYFSVRKIGKWYHE